MLEATRNPLLSAFSNVKFLLFAPATSIAFSLTLSFSLTQTASAQSPASPVTFDVPALIGVREILQEESSVYEKTIEVLLPISSEIGLSDRKNIQEFRFDISWNRDVFPIVDYGPKTQTVSEVNGLVNVETTSDEKGSFGINLSGVIEPISTKANLDASSRNSERLNFERLPKHDVLVASGTVARGTGAFFRFHPSITETLEGGRDLIVAFRVPRQWRAGILQVQCRAVGERKIVGAWKEPLEFGRSFIVPIYLESDDQGRRSATELVRSEQRLLKTWGAWEEKKHSPKLGVWEFPTIGSALNPRSINARTSRLPEHWVHLMIHSGDEKYLSKFQNALPQEVAVEAGKFVQARKNLLLLNR